MSFAWKVGGNLLVLGQGVSGRSVTPVVSGQTPIETTLANSVTYDGVTWNFSTLVPIGRFEAGIKDGAGNYPPFVVSSSAFQITSITPAFSSGANGTMKDPYIPNNQQGWDAQLPNQTGWGSNTPLSYNSSLNVDPGATGSPISITAGDVASYTKAVRVSGATTSDWQQIDRYCTLTVLDAAPQTGSFMPSPSESGTKTIYSGLDMSVARSITMPAGLPSYATMLPYMPRDLGMYGENAIQRRWTRVIQNLNSPYGNTVEQYSSDVAYNYGLYSVHLFNAALDSASKQEIAERICQWAIQISGLVSRGWSGLSGARANPSGQHGAWHWAIYNAAFLLGSSTLLAQAQALHSHIDAKFWQTTDDLDVGIRPNGSKSKNFAIFPHWEENVGRPHMWPEGPTGQTWGSYTGEDASITAWELLLVEGMQNGPGSVNGTEAFLEVSAGQMEASIGDTSNFKSAGLGYYDRIRRFNLTMTNADQFWFQSDWDAIYDAMVSDIGRSIWQGVPDALEYSKGGSNPAGGGALNNDMFSASGNGAIAFTTNGRDFSTATITQTDVRVSMDGGVQFKTFSNVGSSGTISGLLHGQQYYCQIRRQSTAGPSAWSVNLPTDDTDSFLPGVVTTGDGNPTPAAPSLDVSPVIMFNKYPVWVNDTFWDEAPSVLDGKHVDMAAGGGHWTGYPAPTLSYEWQRSADEVTWSTVSTSKFYSYGNADAGQYLQCIITATNSQGAATATTASVLVPTANSLPAGTLVDTEFDGQSVIDYATELSNATATGGTLEHEYNLTVTSLSSGSVSVGRLRTAKTGGTCNLTFPFKGTAVAGTTYSIVADVVAFERDDRTFTNADATFTTTVENSSGTVFFTDVFDSPGDNDSDFESISFLNSINSTFEVPAGTTDLDLFIKIQSNNTNPNPAGGDPMICKLQVVAV